MSKPPFQISTLGRTAARKADGGAAAATYLVEITRYGARVRVAHKDSGGGPTPSGRAQ